MSVGDILPDVLAECGLNVSAPLISATDFQMSQIRSLMTAAGQDIATRAEWSGAIKSTALGMGTSFPLPADFQELAERGAVRINGGYTFARPVVDPGMWELLSAKPSSSYYFHLGGGSLQVAPTIATGTLRYVSRNWLNGNKRRVTVNTDEPIFPDRLLFRGTVWRWKRQKGLPYEDLLAEFEADLDEAIKADRGAQ